MIEYTVRVYEGKTEWYLNGKLHREGGPAVEWADGNKEWFLNGKLHREGGPAIEWDNGSKGWLLNGEYHREDGPAVERSNGDKEWWLNGERHREDGPAIEWADGDKQWWLNGEELPEEDWKKRVSPVKELTVDQIEELLGHKVKVIGVDRDREDHTLATTGDTPMNHRAVAINDSICESVNALISSVEDGMNHLGPGERFLLLDWLWEHSFGESDLRGKIFGLIFKEMKEDKH